MKKFLLSKRNIRFDVFQLKIRKKFTRISSWDWFESFDLTLKCEIRLLIIGLTLFFVPLNSFDLLMKSFVWTLNCWIKIFIWRLKLKNSNLFFSFVFEYSYLIWNKTISMICLLLKWFCWFSSEKVFELGTNVRSWIVCLNNLKKREEKTKNVKSCLMKNKTFSFVHFDLEHFSDSRDFPLSNCFRRSISFPSVFFIIFCSFDKIRLSSIKFLIWFKKTKDKNWQSKQWQNRFSLVQLIVRFDVAYLFYIFHFVDFQSVDDRSTRKPS